MSEATIEKMNRATKVIEEVTWWIFMATAVVLVAGLIL